MKTNLMVVVLLVLVCGVGSASGAWIQYKDGETHNISSTINDDVWVDYQAPGAQTTVNLLPGGNIASGSELHCYQDGRINIKGGSVSGFLFAFDNSLTTMTGGSVGYLYSSGNVAMIGGNVGSLAAEGDSLTTMTGGSVGQLSANTNGHILISGGTVLGEMTTCNNSSIMMTGGSVGHLYAYNDSLITMTGGSAGYLEADGHGRINWSGGTIQGQLILTNDAILSIAGSNFAIDGIPYGSNGIMGILGQPSNHEPWRTITGVLADGSNINSQFQLGYDARIVLVPEPATIGLLALGAVGLLRRKK